jgi:pyridoxal phosphate enzyme (YggS family)
MAAAIIAQNLAALRARIDKAARAAGRRAADITLIAVSKTHDAAAIEAAIAAGQRHFGENRVQEAQAKWPALKAHHPDLVLHLIGPLQTNKVEPAFALFDAIHTLDRPRLADKLVAVPPKQLFIQVNTGEEEQKAGIPPREADGFIAECRARGLDPQGLMCIPPVDEEPALHFALLAMIARRNGLALLSMGMSADFETAIALGATHIRVGNAIFGERPPQSA